MEDVWSWMVSLPSSSSTSWPASLVLAASDQHSILLLADRNANANAGSHALTFSLLLRSPHLPPRTLWLSHPTSSSSSSSSSSSHLLLLLLLHQLLAESISLSPSTTALPSVGLGPEPVSKALDAAREEGAAFMELALLLRLFWLCAVDAPADAGFLFFRALGPALERAPRRCARALGAFLRAAGPDLEERCARSLGYMLAKWCLLRHLQLGSGQGDSPLPLPLPLPSPSPLPLPLPSEGRRRRRRRRRCCCFGYAAEAHGLWLLRGFAPVPAMALVRGCSSAPAPHDAKDAALRYSLAHQQLEAVVQLEYSVSLRDPRFILVGVRVVNIRVHVARLGFGTRGDHHHHHHHHEEEEEEEEEAEEEETEEEEEETEEVEGERHFPSRIRVWVGPEPGAAYATGPSLGRSTGNPEREVETTRTVKGSFASGGKGAAGVKAKARSAARTRGRSWRWEQDAEGAAAVFEGVLCDFSSGAEVATWRPGAGPVGDPRAGMRRRCGGPGRALSKAGGVVVAAAADDEAGLVTWRVGREMEGRRVTWRLGGRFWATYFPNAVKSGFFESRWVEWREEVELHLVDGSALVPKEFS